MNLNLRSQILECSLHMEKEINNLIFLLFGILDGKKTRVFGNKTGNISFKNKIDLLYDLKIFTTEENNDFNLLMIYRNKFLHDIDCDSFSEAFVQLGNGQKKDLNKFIHADENIENEKDCLTAFLRLFSKNLKVLSEKINSKQELQSMKTEIFINFNEQSCLQIDFFYDLIKEIYEKFESLDLNDEKHRNAIIKIKNICNKYSNKYSSDERFLSLRQRQSELMNNSDFKRELWNVVDLKSEQ